MHRMAEMKAVETPVEYPQICFRLREWSASFRGGALTAILERSSTNPQVE